jgi:hypothetical protein
VLIKNSVNPLPNPGGHSQSLMIDTPVCVFDGFSHFEQQSGIGRTIPAVREKSFVGSLLRQ